MRLSAGHANSCGRGSPGLANGTEGMCPAEEGQGLGNSLTDGESAIGSKV